MKLTVKEAKLTGLCARNCANIQQILIEKLSFGPEKFLRLSRNRLQFFTVKVVLSVNLQTQTYFRSSLLSDDRKYICVRGLC